MNIDFSSDELTVIHAACHTQNEQLKDLMRRGWDLNVSVVGPEDQLTTLHSARGKITAAIAREQTP